jgi:NTE family protein
MKPHLRFVATLLSFMSMGGLALNAQLSSGRSARVGVALSGGGALGLAHIGVIRYFEEHHIPVDRIAGTSMGGLIGGLYAVGMDSRQMTELVEHADWDALLNPNARFIDQPVADKQKWNRTFGNLTLKFRKGLALPAGLNSGEAISLFLSRETLAYSEVSDFDELPTPFRCVATDLISGNAVVLGHGSLAVAMRATMSIPAIFTPVRMDGMVLVDGGIVETVPVEVTRSMGVQKVIAVALDAPTPKPEELKSLPDILRQVSNVATAQNIRRSLASADLVISVDTGRFSTTDYKKWREIIQAGYDAAQKQAAQLKPYEVSAEECDEYIGLRQQRMRPAKKRATVVAVDAPSSPFQQNAQAEIHRKLDDRIVSQRELDDVLTGMVAATAVPGASYEWQQGQEGVKGYKIVFALRLGDQVLVRPSLQYGLSPGEPSRTSLRISTATVFANAYKARLLATVNIGYDPGIQTEYYRPFGGSGYFVAPSLVVERYHVDSYQGPARFSSTRDRFGGSLYAGIGTWRFAQLRVGLQAGYDSYSNSPSVDGVKAKSGGFVAPELRWIFDSQDSGGLPTHGTLTEGSVGYSFRNIPYPYFQQHFSTFRPVGNRFSIFGISQGDTSFGKKLDYFEQFTGGGEGQLGAFRYQEFHANTVVTGGAGITIHGPSVLRLSVRPSLALWYEAGRFDLGSQGWQTHQSTSTGILFPTPLGAAGLTLSFDEAGKARFRLLLGSL